MANQTAGYLLAKHVIKALKTSALLSKGFMHPIPAAPG